MDNKLQKEFLGPGEITKKQADMVSIANHKFYELAEFIETHLKNGKLKENCMDHLQVARHYAGLSIINDPLKNLK